MYFLTQLFLFFFFNFEDKVHLKEEGRRVVLELLEEGHGHPDRFMVEITKGDPYASKA